LEFFIGFTIVTQICAGIGGATKTVHAGLAEAFAADQLTAIGLCFVDTTLRQIRAIKGADVLIVTSDWRALAPTAVARIPVGASIIIVTERFIGYELAADLGGTLIVGTEIAIVADQFGTADALPQFARVAEGTDIAIVAKGRVHGEEAPY